jgi:hypothetical protein
LFIVVFPFRLEKGKVTPDTASIVKIDKPLKKAEAKKETAGKALSPPACLTAMPALHGPLLDSSISRLHSRRSAAVPMGKGDDIR